MDVGSILTGGGVVGVLGAVINAVSNRRKLGADASAVITKAATDLVKAQTEAVVKPLREQVRELEAEVETLRRTVRETTAELESCRVQGRAKDRVIRQRDARIADLEAGHHPATARTPSEEDA